MSKVERLYHLHNILSQRRTPISRQDLMERLECSQATLYPNRITTISCLIC